LTFAITATPTIYPLPAQNNSRWLVDTQINYNNPGVPTNKIKKGVLLSVENEQGVELYTGDLDVGPGNGFAVVPGSVRSLALKAVPITPAILKGSKKRSNTQRSHKKPH
jgi:hypothetical protein